MDDSSPRPRRSPVVVLLDAMLGLATRVQTGNLPGARQATVRPGRSRRAGLVWLIAGVLVVAGGTTILIGTLLKPGGGLTDLPPAGKAGPAPVNSVGAPVTMQQAPAASLSPSAGTSATPSASTSVPASNAVAGGSASAAVPPPPPAAGATSGGSHLTAAYVAKYGSGLLGYRASVTLAADGPGPSANWQLVVTLPRATLQIAAVDGATVKQDGAVWTFTPDADTREIAAGRSAVVVFDVRGATLVDAQPTSCRINGEACTGL